MLVAICAKLTMAFKSTSYLWIVTFLFPDVVAVSDLNKTISGSTDLAKRHGSADLDTSIQPPLVDIMQ